ncbi:hypothetical protein Nisw_06580 [Candidatus Nitrosopumilus sp. SW]|uniref:hypothetical protein n=1 Tax=Candidatus Nitrosopumilus sp. SW TaxID=2508726 RepID=UPI0011528FDA|nr:hypothetical protein [Candidatus Nitrosopumilus sp. SW]QDI89210.1 hypothetical protein Nisw_06580 [Candidatus Nitrosopumilus sp. SW]
MTNKIKLVKGIKFKTISPIFIKIMMTDEGKIIIPKTFPIPKQIQVKTLTPIIKINYKIKPGTKIRLPQKTHVIVSVKKFKKSKEGFLIFPKGTIFRLQKDTIIEAPRKPVTPDENQKGKTDTR